MVPKLNGLTEKEREFLYNLIRVADDYFLKENNDKDEYYISQSDLLDKLRIQQGSKTYPSLSTLALRTRQLKSKAVIKTDKLKTLEFIIYKNTIAPLINAISLQPITQKEKTGKKQKRRTQRMVEIQSEFIRADGDITLLDPTEIMHENKYHDKFFSGLFDVCMRMTKKDTRNEIGVTVNIQGQPLTIVSKSIGPRSEIAMMSDLACQRSIVSLVKNIIASRINVIRARMGLDYPQNQEEEGELLRKEIKNLFS